jgi:hypothetical protein
MVLHLVLFDLRHLPPVEDERFEAKWYASGKWFVAWLHDGNAIYRHLPYSERLDGRSRGVDVPSGRVSIIQAVRSFSEHGIMSETQAHRAQEVLESDEGFAGLLAGNIVDVWIPGTALGLDAYERPLNLAAAREWVREHVTWEPEQREYLDMVDLMQADENLWLYESW